MQRPAVAAGLLAGPPQHLLRRALSRERDQVIFTQA